LADYDNEVTADVIDKLPKEEMQICLFSSGENMKAIPIDLLTVLITSQKVFHIPSTPPNLGVINLRGNTLPVTEIRNPRYRCRHFSRTAQVRQDSVEAGRNRSRIDEVGSV